VYLVTAHVGLLDLSLSGLMAPSCHSSIDWMKSHCGGAVICIYVYIYIYVYICIYICIYIYIYSYIINVTVE